jgi:tetratricopeptide (TPR) repeat protein
MLNICVRTLFLSLVLLAVNAVAFGQSPGSEGYYINYAQEYFEAGNFESSANYLTQGISMYPSSAQLHFRLGQTYLRLGRGDEGRAELDRAAALDPSLKERVSALLADNGNGSEAPGSGSRIDAAKFHQGDVVEVKDHASGSWVTGTVVGVQDNSKDGTFFVYRFGTRASVL